MNSCTVRCCFRPSCFHVKKVFKYFEPKYWGSAQIVRLHGPIFPNHPDCRSIASNACGGIDEQYFVCNLTKKTCHLSCDCVLLSYVKIRTLNFVFFHNRYVMCKACLLVRPWGNGQEKCSVVWCGLCLLVTFQTFPEYSDIGNIPRYVCSV
jgi:hypothetical protein